MIKQLEDGRWRDDSVFINGKRKQITRRTKTLLEKAIKKLELQAAEGFGDLPVILFHDLCNEYLDKNLRITQETLPTFQSQIKQFKNYFGNVRITSITKKQVEEWMIAYKRSPNRLGKPIEGSSVNRKFRTLHAIFEKALDWGYLKLNPCDRIQKLEQTPTEPRALPKEELQLLWDAASPRFKVYVTIAFYEGMRPGNILKMRYTDLDFNRRLIKYQVKKGTGWRNRYARMNNVVFNLLWEMYQKATDKNGLVLEYTKNQLRKDAEEAIEVAGINQGKSFQERFTIYGLRHTFATMKLLAGQKPSAVADALGHADEKMVNMHYKKYLPEFLHEVFEAETMELRNEPKASYPTGSLGSPLLSNTPKEIIFNPN